MSKYCPECRQANEDSRIFCSCCGVLGVLVIAAAVGFFLLR